jgi:hypothetical protein
LACLAYEPSQANQARAKPKLSSRARAFFPPRVPQEGSRRLNRALGRATVAIGQAAACSDVSWPSPVQRRGEGRATQSAGILPPREVAEGRSPRVASAMTRVVTPAGILTPGRSGGVHLHLFLQNLDHDRRGRRKTWGGRKRLPFEAREIPLPSAPAVKEVILSSKRSWDPPFVSSAGGKGPPLEITYPPPKVAS